MNNAILLYWFHHDYLHSNNIAITLTRDGFTFARPDGTIIT